MHHLLCHQLFIQLLGGSMGERLLDQHPFSDTEQTARRGSMNRIQHLVECRTGFSHHIVAHRKWKKHPLVTLCNAPDQLCRSCKLKTFVLVPTPEP